MGPIVIQDLPINDKGELFGRLWELLALIVVHEWPGIKVEDLQTRGHVGEGQLTQG
jgi:hypothetical protein